MTRNEQFNKIVDGNGNTHIIINDGGDLEFSRIADLNGNDLEDSGTTIWDNSLGEIPDNALGSIDNATLTNDSITVANNTINLGGSTSVSVNDLSDVASPNATSAGQLLIYDGTNLQFENSTLTGGNAISVANNDASVTLSVPTDGIGTDEVDQTAAFSFSNLGATTISGDLDMSNSNIDDLASFDGGGDAINSNDAINLANSDNIQDAGTDAIQFDGSASVTIPNGNLNANAGATVNNDFFTIDTSSEIRIKDAASQSFRISESSEQLIFDNTDDFGNILVLDKANESVLIPNGNLNLNDNLIADPSNNTTGDSMTANPETDTEDGYIEVEIDGTTRQIPFYNQ